MAYETAMRGLVSLEDVMASLPEGRRKSIEAEGAKLVAKIRRRMERQELARLRRIERRKTLNIKDLTM